MMLTFPFPVDKASNFLKGDYANLSLHLDISLNDNLCGLNIPGLCDLVNALSPPTKKTAASHTTQSSTVGPIPLTSLSDLGG
jgi:hypothetical protein